jgi:hypothetical protein
MKAKIFLFSFFLVLVKQSQCQQVPSRCNETFIAIISSFSSQTNQYLAVDLLNTISTLSTNFTRANFVEVFKKNIQLFRMLQNNPNDRQLMEQMTRSIFTFKNDFTWSINQFCYALENIANSMTRFSSGNMENIKKLTDNLFSNYPKPLDVFTALYNDNYFKQLVDYLLKSDPIPMQYLLNMIGVK